MNERNHFGLSGFLSLAFILLSLSPALATDCTLNGREVPPDCFRFNQCGAQSGRMICKQSNGQPYGEWEIRQGKHIGREVTYDNAGGKVEQSVDERGQPQGAVKRYAPTGALLSEQTYVNGQPAGKRVSYFPNGKPERIGWWENGRLVFDVKYLADGGVASLLCGDRPYVDEAASLCGFNGQPSQVAMNGASDKARTVSYANGKLRAQTATDSGGAPLLDETVDGDTVRSKSYYPNGKLKLQTSTKGGMPEGMEYEYFQSGQAARQTLWKDGERMAEDLFYQNGQKKSHMDKSRNGDYWIKTENTFHENGVTAREGRYQSKSPIEDARPYRDGFENFAPIGEQRVYDSRGTLMASYTYDDNGHIRHIKTWDAEGRPQRDEAVFGDGSANNRLR